jgi:hypothetical protein
MVTLLRQPSEEFRARGGFMRQNGPSNADAVSVAPLLPLFEKADQRREADHVGVFVPQ